MRAKGGYVYIMSNVHRNVLYIGVTSDLYARVTQHKNGEGSVFTKKYNCHDLVYFQFFDTILEAIEMEKKMKKWSRRRKDLVIKEFNPKRLDLYDSVVDYR